MLAVLAATAALALPTGIVEQVADGNTLIVRMDGTGRQLTVDLAGTDVPRLSPPDCGSSQAHMNLQRLAGEGTNVTIRPAGRGRRAYVSAGRRDVGRAQIRAGWARVLGHVSRDYRAAQRAAKREPLGVWLVCDGDFRHTLD